MRRGLVEEERVLDAAAEHCALQRWDGALPLAGARELLDEGLARRYGVIPVSATAGALTIATANPFDLDCEQVLAFATGRTIRPLLASPGRITRGLDELYAPPSHSGASSARVHEAERVMHAEGEIVQLVDALIADGVSSRASDIHLEHAANGVAVRHRVDGVLRHVRTLEPSVGLSLVSRIKIMAGLDIADRLRPQDGRLSVAVSAGQVDLRVSTLPAAHGEKVVLRVLDTRAGAATLDSLGASDGEIARLRTLLEAREGLMLVTGPTGSGKTTTLYGALRAIQQRGVNIVTVEDPIEYRLPGVVQVQVSVRTGLTFAAALRSILRQDPDVILVGEIRDAETASIAVQAALTGHLVLSTLHTIDAAGAIARLDDLGVDRYKVAASLKGVVAQRLLRRLCERCRIPDESVPGPALGRWVAADAPRWREQGCAACGRAGFRGRLAVLETLLVSPSIERAIATGAAPDRIGELARAEGMQRLWEGGIERVRAGLTSLAEVGRVLDIPLPPPTEALVRRARESVARPIAASLDDFELIDPG
ncbi:MAG TPA: GspE/PulE family protein [Gemmatimonadaceae bacterium]|nr:GspE/PulE family protein [Gemmatimonadaceae bacterium]